MSLWVARRWLMIVDGFFAGEDGGKAFGAFGAGEEDGSRSQFGGLRGRGRVWR